MVAENTPVDPDDNVTADDLLARAMVKLRKEEQALQNEYATRLEAITTRISALALILGERAAVAAATAAPEKQPGLFPSDTLPPERPTLPRPPVIAWKKVLNGMTQSQALLRIAEEFGGELVLRDAKTILSEAGLAKGNPKNIPGQLFHLASRMKEFKKDGPGVFRLVDPAAAADVNDQAVEPQPGETEFKSDGTWQVVWEPGREGESEVHE